MIKQIMNFPKSFFVQYIALFFAPIVFFFFALFPSAAFAKDFNFNSDITKVAETFSDKYCLSIAEGISAEKSAEVASRSMIQGLIFSGFLKEVMSAPKEDMALFVTKKIFDRCGEELLISEKDLNIYLMKLAETGSNQAKSKPQPFQPFGLG